MAKEATLQVRMDAELKEKAEELYRSMGTSLAEAVRIFAKQSVEENAMPFVMHGPRNSIRGIASKYANSELRELENNAFERAMIDKHEDNN